MTPLLLLSCYPMMWERLLDLAQARGVELGMTFLDDTNVRAHAKAAGASKRGDQEQAALVKRLAEAVAGMAPKPA